MLGHMLRRTYFTPFSTLPLVCGPVFLTQPRSRKPTRRAKSSMSAGSSPLGRLRIVLAQGDHLGIVVKAPPRYAAQILKGVDVALDERLPYRLCRTSLHVAGPGVAHASSQTPRHYAACRTICTDVRQAPPVHLGLLARSRSQTASSPPVDDASAVAATRSPSGSNSRRHIPRRHQLPVQAPRSFPALLPSDCRCTPCTGPAGTPVVCAVSVAWPPATSGISSPYCATRPAPGQSPGSSGPRLSARRSLSLDPPLAICLSHLRGVSAQDAITIGWVSSISAILLILISAVTLAIMVPRLRPLEGVAGCEVSHAPADPRLSQSPCWALPIIRHVPAWAG